MSKPARYYALREVAASQSKHPNPVARAVELIASSPQMWAFRAAARAMRQDGITFSRERRAELFEALGGKPGPVESRMRRDHGW